MDGIGVLVIWLLLCYAVTVYAGKKGRSQIGFFLLSLFLSPSRRFHPGRSRSLQSAKDGT